MRLFACSLTVGLVLLAGAVALPAQREPTARIVAPINNRQRVRLRGNTLPMARPENDRGAAAPDLPLNDMLLLLRRSPGREVALQRLLDEQREKGSPHYHRWLTPAEFGARFGAAPEDIAKITDWLATSGFTVNQVAAGRGVIEFSGTPVQVEAALHTAIHRYQVRGAMRLANAGDPSIPAALAPVVAGVVSLNNFRARATGHIIAQGHAPAPSPGRARSSLTYIGSDNQVEHALVPADIAAIYDGSPLNGDTLRGGGVAVAVVARSDVHLNDIADFQSLFVGRTSPALATIEVGADPGVVSGDDAPEATLDAEWAQALAPEAQIELVVSAGSQTTDGIALAALFAVDNDLAPIVSVSFSACEADLTASENQFWSSLWEQAAAEGISALVSAGDSGAAACDDPETETVANRGPAVNGVASTPYDTAVGGTEFLDQTGGPYWTDTSSSPDLFESARGYIPEAAWNESEPASAYQPAIWAGGGGPSSIYAKPTWQSGPGVLSDGHRDLPDISLAASSHDGYVVCWNSSCEPGSNGLGFVVFGGTSAATPAIAGFLAQVNEQQGGPLGLINPILYRLAESPAATAFHDILAGSNQVPCSTGSPGCAAGTLGYPAGAGYDLATGLGSVDISHALHGWGAISFSSSTTALTVSAPKNWTYGDSVSVSVQVSGKVSSPVPTGDAVLIAVTPNGDQDEQTVVLNASGGAVATMSGLPAGQYSLVARYGGDVTYGASVSAPFAVAIAKATPEVTFAVLEPGNGGALTPISSSVYGAAIVVQASVKPRTGTGTPSGQVVLSGLVGFLQLDRDGNALSRNLYAPAAGAATLEAQYGGDANFNPANSTPLSLAVAKAPTTTSITPTVEPTFGRLYFGVSVSSSAVQGANPHGVAEFYAGAAALGAANVSGNGPTAGVLAATGLFYPNTLPGTSAAITARFSGDDNYLPSTSAAVTIATPANLSPSPSSFDFGPVPVNTASAPQTVVFTNLGGMASPGLSLIGGGYYGFGQGCNEMIAPGASCTTEITFRPGVAGAADQTFQSGSSTLSLSGTGAGYSVTTTAPTTYTISAGQTVQVPLIITPEGGWNQPVALSCGSQSPPAPPMPLGACSLAQTTVALDGVHSVSDLLTITSTAAPSVSSGPWVPRSGPWRPLRYWGLLFTAVVVFAGLCCRAIRRRRKMAVLGLGVLVALGVACGGGPSYGGNPATGTGTSSSSTGSPGGSGDNSGNPPPPPVPVAVFSPASLTFPNVLVGQTDPPQQATLTNQGPGPFEIDQITPASPWFTQTDNCPASPRTLAQGASCTFTIVYAPNWYGSDSASLRINGGMPALNLTGTAYFNATPKGSYTVMITSGSGAESELMPEIYINVQ